MITEINIEYYIKGTLKKVSFQDRNLFQNDDLLVFHYATTDYDENIVGVVIESQSLIILKSLNIVKQFTFYNQEILANGYQSWSESKEQKVMESDHNLNPLGNLLELHMMGDYAFNKRSNEPGVVYSHGFVYIIDKSEAKHFTHHLIGSIDEKNAGTLFECRHKDEKLIIHKDVEGLMIESQAVSLLEKYSIISNKESIYDLYFNQFKNHRKLQPTRTGWSSWHQYFNRINEEILMKELHAIIDKEIPFDFFHIEDGYQKAVGDWLYVKEEFGSITSIISAIKKAHMIPSLWLAPFVCEKDSDILKDHPEWILRNESSNKVKGGFNQFWGGTFYTLDFYNVEVQQYVKQVIQHYMILGIEMFKMDYLYVVGIYPRNGKSRHQMFQDMLIFLNECMGDKIFWASGIPLMLSVGEVDYCRTGPFNPPFWDEQILKRIGFKERMSIYSGLITQLTRHMFNGRGFLSDTDVFILRDSNKKLNDDQRKTLFIVNNILGGLITTSDSVDGYSPKTDKLFKSMFPKKKTTISFFSNDQLLYLIVFHIENWEYYCYINLNDHEKYIDLKEGEYFYLGGIVSGGTHIRLLPHETIIMKKIMKDEYIIGSDGHLFPCAEVTILKQTIGRVFIEIHPKFINKGFLYSKIPLDVYNHEEKLPMIWGIDGLYQYEIRRKM